MNINTAKYTVITGASSGIGREAAKAFASRNKNLVLIARRLNKLESLKDEILSLQPALEVVIMPFDLSVPENAHNLYEKLSAYSLETWINCAGFGNYSSIAQQDLNKIEKMLSVNICALTILSSLFVRDYKDVDGAQLINISSAGGYTVVPNAVTYCASKFFVSAFTEGLARELKSSGAKMQAKVLAPAATQTEFGLIASDLAEYDYDVEFHSYHTADQMASFLLELYESEFTVGIVNRNTFEFKLSNPIFK